MKLMSPGSWVLKLVIQVSNLQYSLRGFQFFVICNSCSTSSRRKCQSALPTGLCWFSFSRLSSSPAVWFIYVLPPTQSIATSIYIHFHSLTFDFYFSNRFTFLPSLGDHSNATTGKRGISRWLSNPQKKAICIDNSDQVLFARVGPMLNDHCLSRDSLKLTRGTWHVKRPLGAQAIPALKSNWREWERLVKIWHKWNLGDWHSGWQLSC